MTWTITASLDEFRAAAGEYLAAHPAENTALLTIADRLERNGLNAFGAQPPRFGWWRPRPDAPVDGVFLQTPPYPPRLGRTPVGAGAALADALHARGEALAAVSGGKAAALAFAERWQRLTGAEPVVRTDERLYRLDGLTPPSPAPEGRFRLARSADRELLIEWLIAFVAEAEVMEPDLDAAAIVDQRIAERSWHIWESAGRPVSFAGASPVIAGMSRIGPVYTPPEHRRNGYAGAVVAGASAHAVAEGAGEVLLYTDLANPTSNSVYQKLGYRPVEDCIVLDLN
ncbi:GNAT family N-acetyltransferase [Kitasatospora sp. NPDC048365]|uniref:GNAT family N-acetyltransferase n=1 Tax=Kitasatospora sp. NPDC048365 TaxID=3364050 RepID=UPI00371D38B9